ncbi:MAG TPA: hypothetical protein VFL93_15795 [Longimicrobiaceae bacterium]|nr:hypothetical protein [Longimicrobiaceae bacterium]
MSATDWAVLVAGVTAIAWVNWYFFVAESRARGSRRKEGKHGDDTE